MYTEIKIIFLKTICQEKLQLVCVEASSCNVNPRTNMISEGRVGPQSGKGMIFFIGI